MYKILIDTVTRENYSVKLTKNCREIEIVKGDFDVASVVSDLLKKHKVNLYDVEFAANPGPGSFTGIKAGVTIANVLNWALGKKTIGEQIKPEYGREPNIDSHGQARGSIQFMRKL